MTETGSSISLIAAILDEKPERAFVVAKAFRDRGCDPVFCRTLDEAYLLLSGERPDILFCSVEASWDLSLLLSFLDSARSPEAIGDFSRPYVILSLDADAAVPDRARRQAFDALLVRPFPETCLDFSVDRSVRESLRARSIESRFLALHATFDASPRPQAAFDRATGDRVLANRAYLEAARPPGRLEDVEATDGTTFDFSLAGRDFTAHFPRAPLDASDSGDGAWIQDWDRIASRAGTAMLLVDAGARVLAFNELAIRLLLPDPPRKDAVPAIDGLDRCLPDPGSGKFFASAELALLNGTVVEARMVSMVRLAGRTAWSIDFEARDSAELDSATTAGDALARSIARFPERFARSFQVQASLVESLFATSRRALFLLDRSGTVRRQSSRAISLFGAAEGRRPGIERLVREEDARRLADSMSRAIVSGSCCARLDFRGVGDRTEPVLATFIALFDSGSPYGFLLECDTGEILDRFSTPDFDAIIESSPKPSLLIGIDRHTVIGCNIASSAVTGFSKAELLNSPISLLLSREDAAGVLEPNEGSGFSDIDSRVRRKDGSSFKARISAAPFFHPAFEIPLTFITITDTTWETRRDAARAEILGRMLSVAREIEDIAKSGETTTGGTTLSSFGLTPRQIEIARCVAAGMSNKQIAHAIGCSEASVKVHVSTAYRRLAVKNRVEFLSFVQDRRAAFR